MSRKMLINARHVDELRVAIVDNDTLEGYEVEAAESGLTRGNIYRGVVVKIETSLNAAFIDYGAERHGFLPGDDVVAQAYHKQPNGKERRPTIGNVLEKGKSILVQVNKEAVGKKGAALTTNVSLAGRYLVLTPFDGSRGLSRKIDDESGRKKLKRQLSTLDVPDNCGIIARTNAQDQNKTSLNRDLSALLRMWKRIQDEAAKRTQGARLLYSDQDLVLQALRDYLDTSIEEVHVDSEEVLRKSEEYMKAFMPRAKTQLVLYDGRIPLFARYHLDQQIERIYERSVDLPSGSSIVIDGTEALTAIDVNSGKTRGASTHEETVTNTNVEAAHEVARQLRLRDIGGLVVVDFIDMRLKRNHRKVEKALKDAMKPDRARVSIGRISSNGLLEINRQRIKQALQLRTHRTCPTCNGASTIASPEFIALGLLRRIEARAAAGDLKTVLIRLHPELADAVQNLRRKELVELELEFGINIQIIAATHLHRTEQELEWKRWGRGEKPTVPTPGQLKQAQTVLTPSDFVTDSGEAPEEEDDERDDERDDDRGRGRNDNGDESSDGGRHRKRRRRKRRRRGGRSDDGDDTSQQQNNERDEESQKASGSDQDGRDQDDDQRGGEESPSRSSSRRRRRRRRRGGSRSDDGGTDTQSNASEDRDGDVVADPQASPINMWRADPAATAKPAARTAPRTATRPDNEEGGSEESDDSGSRRRRGSGRRASSRGGSPRGRRRAESDDAKAKDVSSDDGTNRESDDTSDSRSRRRGSSRGSARGGTRSGARRGSIRRGGLLDGVPAENAAATDDRASTTTKAPEPAKNEGTEKPTTRRTSRRGSSRSRTTSIKDTTEAAGADERTIEGAEPQGDDAPKATRRRSTRSTRSPRTSRSRAATAKDENAAEALDGKAEGRSGDVGSSSDEKSTTPRRGSSRGRSTARRGSTRKSSSTEGADGLVEDSKGSDDKAADANVATDRVAKSTAPRKVAGSDEGEGVSDAKPTRRRASTSRTTTRRKSTASSNADDLDAKEAGASDSAASAGSDSTATSRRGSRSRATSSKGSTTRGSSSKSTSAAASKKTTTRRSTRTTTKATATTAAATTAAAKAEPAEALETKAAPAKATKPRSRSTKATTTKAKPTKAATTKAATTKAATTKAATTKAKTAKAKTAAPKKATSTKATTTKATTTKATPSKASTTRSTKKKDAGAVADDGAEKKPAPRRRTTRRKTTTKPKESSED